LKHLNKVHRSAGKVLILSVIARKSDHDFAAQN
jgi:hypothetical protein